MAALANQRHEKFAQALASGKTQREAYVAAGYKYDEPNASRLTRNDKVVARVAELQERAAANVVLSREWVLERLIENADRAMQAVAVKDREGNPTGEYTYQGNVANRALELLGKEMGMFVDRKHIDLNADLNGLSDRELIALAADALESGEESGKGLPH